MPTRLNTITTSIIATLCLSSIALAQDEPFNHVADEVISAQHQSLAQSTDGAGYGPQSPRDLTAIAGENNRVFEPAPDHTVMNLCNIHFHENAEHKGGMFTTYAGNGDGHGNGTGYKYNGTLTEAELSPVGIEIGKSEHGSLEPGDTIEVHYVFSSAQVKPGPTLGACLSDAIQNPQLRVEAQVMVLVNDPKAIDFGTLNEVTEVNGFSQAPNIPTTMGTSIKYAGSTTGPKYNEAGSPLQVTWAVRPDVAKVNISTVDTWLKSNVFEESHAHGVRNLVTLPQLLSTIEN